MYSVIEIYITQESKGNTSLNVLNNSNLYSCGNVQVCKSNYFGVKTALILACMVSVLAHPAHACSDDARILFSTCDKPAKLHLRPLGPENPAPLGTAHSLVVTGAYSSADRYGIEGLAVNGGKVVSKRFQGWDGLAVMSDAGALTLHHVENVNLSDKSFNLREIDSRKQFLELASEQKLSVIQSHLLIVDGEVDIISQPGRPKFTRRMLFSTKAGKWGVFDTGKIRYTLYDATLVLEQLVSPVMAFNLDMGAFDYCMIEGEKCGLLPNSATKILTNVLIADF